MKHDIADIRLASKGKSRIEWAGAQMPVLELIAKRFVKEKPLKGIKLSACLHVTSETANLMVALKAGGADAVLVASNPLSTQDDVAASLVKDFGIRVFAIKGEDRKSYYSHIYAALDHHPHITMDDGADLVSAIHKEPAKYKRNIFGGTMSAISRAEEPRPFDEDIFCPPTRKNSYGTSNGGSMLNTSRAIAFATSLAPPFVE